MSKFRQAEIYIGFTNQRKLSWMADLYETTPDALADTILTRFFNNTFPELGAVEAEYSKGQRALKDQAVKRFKEVYPNKLSMDQPQDPETL